MTRQRGVALITALLVTALAAVLAAVMLTRHSLALTRAQAQVEREQAMQYALGAEHFARQVLAEDFARREEADGVLVDALDEPWAAALPPFEVEDGVLELAIRDLDGRFNLNSLAAAGPGSGGGAGGAAGAGTAREQLRTLLFNLGLQEGHADTIADWVDADDQVSGLGAEDSTYLAMQPPYRAANQPFTDLSELALLDQMDAETLAILRPHVSALPGGAAVINVNTAGRPVLQAIAGPGADLPVLVSEGGRAPYSSRDEVVQEAPTLAAVVDRLSVHSRFFEVLARCSYGERTVRMRSILYRDPNSGEIAVLRRSFGGPFAVGPASDLSPAP